MKTGGSDIMDRDSQKLKEQHEKIRNITNDVYNNFYISVKHAKGTEEDWKTLIMGQAKEIAEKYGGDRFCKDLLLAFENELERNWIEIKELDRKNRTKPHDKNKQLSR